MKYLKYSLVILTIALFGCQSGSKQEEEQGDANDGRTTAMDLPKPPSLDAGIIMKCEARCDYLDIIFYDLPMSVSQDDVNSIRSTLRFYSDQPTSHLPECRSIGRMAYMIEGNIFLEAEIYFSPGCQYFGFIEDQKPTYFHPMTPSAVRFFRNIIGQKPGGG